MGRLLALATVSVLIVGCSGDGRTYSADEVVDAFQRHGYVLVPFEIPGAASTSVEGSLLTPRGREPFSVIVATDREADEVWSMYESQQTYETFDARRANVVATSDSGLRAIDRRRVLAALSSLPDRGAEVVIAGKATSGR